MLVRDPSETEGVKSSNEGDEVWIMSTVLTKSFSVIGESEVNKAEH